MIACRNYERYGTDRSKALPNALWNVKMTERKLHIVMLQVVFRIPRRKQNSTNRSLLYIVQCTVYSNDLSLPFW